MNRYYLQAPDGQCLYSVETNSYGATFEGAVGQGRSLGGGRYLHFVLTSEPVQVVRQTTHHTEYVEDHWTLRDAALQSERLPLTLTNSDYIERVDSAGDDDPLTRFYTRDTRSVVTTTEIDVSGHLPLQADSVVVDVPNNWSPSEWVRIYGVVAQHLVPGVLTGFRKHIKAIGNTYGDCYDHDGPTTMKFFVRAYYDPPKMKKEKVGRKYHERETWMTSQFSLPVSDAIAGNTLAEAQAEWERRTAEIVEILDGYGQTRTCGHCDGRGHLVVGPTKGTD